MAERAERIEADVAVIGGGPAGIAAACRAAESGRRVVLLDQSPRAGGQVWRHSTPAALPGSARRWLHRLARSGARVVPGATVVAATDGFELLAEVDGEPLVVSSGALVLATGARELFLPFPGWTLPNVLGVGGVQALLKSGASFADRRVVVAGSGPLLLPVAALLARGGARVELVAEQAAPARVLRFAAGLWRGPRRLAQAALYRLSIAATPYRTGTWVARASGEGAVQSVTLTDGVGTRTLPCDVLCTGYGLIPNLELPRLLGCRVERGRVVVDTRQHTSVRDIYCAGEPTGIGGVEASLVEGEIAGCAAADRPQDAERLFARRDRARSFGDRMEAAFALRPELHTLPEPDTVVCRCEDVRIGEIHPGWSTRQAKLYTRAGMGACQGRICGPALQHFFRGESGGGTDSMYDTVRAPVVNATVGTLTRFPSSTPST